MIVLTHVVACDGQKAKLIANLEQIALLHNFKNKPNETEQTECQNVMDVNSSTRVMFVSCHTVNARGCV
jgi:hypothetical protein